MDCDFTRKTSGSGSAGIPNKEPSRGKRSGDKSGGGSKSSNHHSGRTSKHGHHRFNQKKGEKNEPSHGKRSGGDKFDGVKSRSPHSGGNSKDRHRRSNDQKERKKVLESPSSSRRSSKSRSKKDDPSKSHSKKCSSGSDNGDPVKVPQPSASDTTRLPETAPTPTYRSTFNRKEWASRSTGLKNQGFTGWMNVVLQCLANTDPLKEYFLSGDFQTDINTTNPLGSGGEVAREFTTTLRSMWEKRNGQHQPTITNPRSFFLAFGRNNFQFARNEPQDACEFSTALIDFLHEDTNRVKKKPYMPSIQQEPGETDLEAANKALENFSKRNVSFPMDLLRGQIKTQVECSVDGCDGRLWTMYDPSVLWSLPLPENKIDDNTTITLLDCFDEEYHPAAINPASMQNNQCTQCQKRNTPHMEKRSIFRMPPILVIRLKRWSFRRCGKIDSIVEYPLANLDLTSRCAHWDNPQEKPVYDLYAVICHSTTSSGGTYSAYIQNPILGWCHYHDETVRIGLEATEVVSNEAYMLFYQRRDQASQLFEQMKNLSIKDREGLASLFPNEEDDSS